VEIPVPNFPGTKPVGAGSWMWLWSVASYAVVPVPAVEHATGALAGQPAELGDSLQPPSLAHVSPAAQHAVGHEVGKLPGQT
jgi:hypothetical protein